MNSKLNEYVFWWFVLLAVATGLFIRSCHSTQALVETPALAADILEVIVPEDSGSYDAAVLVLQLPSGEVVEIHAGQGEAANYTPGQQVQLFRLGEFSGFDEPAYGLKDDLNRNVVRTMWITWILVSACVGYLLVWFGVHRLLRVRAEKAR